MRLVEVKWIDSISHLDTPWIAEEDLEKRATPGECWSVGYLFSEDDSQVTLTLSRAGDDRGEVGVSLTIPRCAVQAIYSLQRELPPLMTM